MRARKECALCFDLFFVELLWLRSERTVGILLNTCGKTMTWWFWRMCIVNVCACVLMEERFYAQYWGIWECGVFWQAIVNQILSKRLFCQIFKDLIETLDWSWFPIKIVWKLFWLNLIFICRMMHVKPFSYILNWPTKTINLIFNCKLMHVEPFSYILNWSTKITRQITITITTTNKIIWS